MIRLIHIVFFITIVQPVFPQGSFQALLDSIAENNKMLAAGRQYSESQKLNARTGIFLANPSVSFDKLSNPAGNYSEMIISQSFDFPSAYVQKSKIADLTATRADEQYRMAKLEVSSDAALVYAELVYINRKISILTGRRAMAIRLETGMEKRLRNGDADIFEANRVRSELAKTQNELQITESKRNSLNLQMTGLNGGKTIFVNDTVLTGLGGFTVSDSTLSTISSRNPLVKQWETETQINVRNISLYRSLGLPKFEVGFRQDINLSQKYSGFHTGITIPLFENKNTVKTAISRRLYAADATDAYKQQLQSHVLQLLEEYNAVNQSLAGITVVFNTLNTPELLLKAYNAGEISYTEFFTEYENYQQLILYIEELKQKAMALNLQLYVLAEL